MPYFRMNGRDIAHYILADGIQISGNDVDSPKSGRVLGNAEMHRGKVAEKQRYDIKLWPVQKDTLDWIFPILRNQYFTVQTDLIPGMGPTTMQVYNSTRKATLTTTDTQGKMWYMNSMFNIIQR